MGLYHLLLDLMHGDVKVVHVLLCSRELSIHAVDALECGVHLLKFDGQPVVILLLKIRKELFDGNFGVLLFLWLYVLVNIVLGQGSV